MSYLVNQHSAIPPPGSIMPYIGGGNTANGVNTGDPGGWVICDGKLRTATDNKFKNLYSILNTYMGVTSNTANSITPPDLTSRFIYGQSSAGTTTKNSGGNASVTLAKNNIPSLDISVDVKDNGHAHGLSQVQDLIKWNTVIPDRGLSSDKPYNVGGIFFGGTNTGYAKLTASGSYNNANPQSVTILPPYTTMNYIMKY